MMDYYLFPFGAIKKDCKIVLYAAGNVGQDYYRQLMDTAFCEVVLWVDKNPDGNLVLEPEAILNLDENDYDLVVIAVENKKVVQQIKSKLIGFGISEDRIFHCHPILSKCRQELSELNLDDFFSSAEKVRNTLREYFYKSGGDTIYFSALIDEIKQAIMQDRYIHASIEYRAYEIIDETDLPIEAAIVLLRVLFEADCLSPKLTQVFVSLIEKIKNNSAQKYWLLFDLSYMWLFCPNILYEGFFEEKKRITRDFAEELQLIWNPPCYQDGDNRNICVLVPIIASNDNVAQLISPIAKELDRRGYNIHVIDFGPMRWDCGANFLKPLYSTHNLKWPSIFPRNELLSDYPEGINLYYAVSAMMRARLQEILDLICKLNPYCIFDFTDELSIISNYYSQKYPTIYFPLRVQDRSSSFFHKIAVSSSTNVTVKPPINSEQILYLPPFIGYVEPIKIYKRSDYGFLTDDIIVTTVGKRLPSDISSGLIDQFCPLLRQETKLKWVCVGCDELPYLRKHYPDLIDKSVFFLEHENDLPGFYGICDIYLNPKRVGGGTTIAWAMQQGLALASPLGAEAGIWHAGTDFAVETEADLVPYVLSMAKDPQLLNQNKDAMLEKMSKLNIKEYIDKLISEMDKLVKEFAETSEE